MVQCARMSVLKPLKMPILNFTSRMKSILSLITGEEAMYIGVIRATALLNYKGHFKDTLYC